MTEMIHGTITGNEYSRPGEYAPWFMLAAAIVKSAVDDYVRVLRKLWRKTTDIKKKRKLIVEKAELEEFFHSEWYGMLTDIDPDRLIYECRIRAREKEEAAIARANRKKIKKLLDEAE